MEKEKVDLTTLAESGITEAYDTLEAYTEENNIDLDTTVYRLNVDDVICVLAEKFKSEIAEGRFTVEEAIEAVKDKMDIDWTEYIKATIEAVLLD